MDINKLSKLIWKNSADILFGTKDVWDDDTFLKPWFDKNELSHLYDYGSPGWYWFVCNLSYQELSDIYRPNSLPISGCDFGAVSRDNIELFGENKLCVYDRDGVVIYNGHEGNVISRVRAHFNLNNNRTGALGIKHYAFNSKTWRVKVFTKQLISIIPQQAQEEVERLIENKTGRCAVESAWRANNGWPILCKQ